MKFALALSLVLAGTPHPSTTTATAAQGYEAFSKRELFLAAERFRSKSRIATSRAEEAERDAAELAQALDEASRDRDLLEQQARDSQARGLYLLIGISGVTLLLGFLGGALVTRQ